MARAAAALLEGLQPAQRAKAAVPFPAEDRLDWHFIPRERSGLPLGAMDPKQRDALWSLVRTGLSNRGVQRLQSVLALEGVLRRIESTPEKPATWRDPARYFVRVYGDPLGEDAWGWRLEGHHLSVHFTLRDGEVYSTPFFLGANPRWVADGPHAGLRLLEEEDGLARGLYRGLDAEQRAAAQAGEPSKDVSLLPGGATSMPAKGLAASSMSASQRAELHSLVETWITLLAPSLAKQELARLRGEQFDGLVFAWLGDDAPRAPHGWRVFSDSFSLEWVTPRSEASHVHAQWRDRTRDFGGQE